MGDQDQDLQGRARRADADGVTPDELANITRSMAELTAALTAFIAAAERVYPKLVPLPPLARRLWPPHLGHPRPRGEIPHTFDGVFPTDP